MSVEFSVSLTDLDGNTTAVASDDTTTMSITDSSNYALSTDNRFVFNNSDFRRIEITQPDGSVYVLCTDGSCDQRIPYIDETGLNPVNSFVVPIPQGDGRYDIKLIVLTKYKQNGALAHYKVDDFAEDDTHIIYKCIQEDDTSVSRIHNTAYWLPTTIDQIEGSKFVATASVLVVSTLNKMFYDAMYEAAVYDGTGIDNIEDPDSNDKLRKAMRLNAIRFSIEDSVSKNNWTEALSMLNYSKSIEDE